MDQNSVENFQLNIESETSDFGDFTSNIAENDDKNKLIMEKNLQKLKESQIVKAGYISYESRQNTKE